MEPRPTHLKQCDIAYAISVITIVVDFAYFMVADSTWQGIERAIIVSSMIFGSYFSFCVARLGPVAWFSSFVRNKTAAFSSVLAVLLLIFLNFSFIRPESTIYEESVPSWYFTESMFWFPFLPTHIHVIAIRQLHLRLRPWTKPTGKVWWIGVLIVLGRLTSGYFGYGLEWFLNDLLSTVLVLLLVYSISQAWKEKGSAQWTRRTRMSR